MTEFSEGDLIEATKTEIASSTRLRGVLKPSGRAGGFVLQSQSYHPELRWLKEQGFELTFIEKAAPALPTEPGTAWHASTGDLWIVDLRGELKCPQTTGGLHKFDDATATAFAPFTRLEPVADTAKKIADWVDAGEWSWGKTNPALTNSIRNQFGVTS